MSFLIKEAGILSTFQDLGRYGYQSTGISPSGALDYKSAMLANQLVGNKTDEAVIEMTLTGISFDVLKDTTIGIAGAEMEIVVNGTVYPVGYSISLAKGDFVKLGRMTKGLRTYLAVAGGFKIDKELGSYATHTRTSMGGYKGRALMTGDRLPYNGDNSLTLPNYLTNTLDLDSKTIRTIPGPNYDDLTTVSKEAFTSQPYKITRSNDRMGIRLDGVALETVDAIHDILSEPTELGSIQVPKNGQPIILLNDRQTTGGYKRMASVAKIDLPKLVQMKPDDDIHFEMITLETAVDLYQAEMKKLKNLEYLVQNTDHQYYRRVKAERIEKLIMR